MPFLRWPPLRRIRPAIPAKRSGTARLVYGLSFLVLAMAALVLIGLIRFAIPPAAENDPSPTDAIVVLTGGKLRLESGIDLLRAGKGRMLFVSGVGAGVTIDDLRRSTGKEILQSLIGFVVLGHGAENTAGNAVETGRWMRRQHYHSLRLVTSWYHMARSLLEFERAMPEIEIVPHPVFSEQSWRLQKWRARRSLAALLVGEYAKYLAVLFFPFIDQGLSGDPLPIAVEAHR